MHCSAVTEASVCKLDSFNMTSITVSKPSNSKVRMNEKHQRLYKGLHVYKCPNNQNIFACTTLIVKNFRKTQGPAS